MLKDQLAVYELLRDIVRGKTGEISKVTFVPQKPVFPEGELQQQFPRSTPEEQGVSSRYLAEFVREMARQKTTDIHNIMILRNGHVIGEFSYAPYQRGMWHISHSMCKSITGMAIGLLIAEGKLTLADKVVKILSQKSLLAGVRQKNITVEHLLTMTSGVAFNELGIVSGDDWVKEYLHSSVNGNPGEQFEYNSMNTYILSAIVTEITGESMMEYLRPRLFEPLGITKVFWESCPRGITKGGWGLFLCQEDAAKLGQLYLQQGRWHGVQIIPEKWVEISTKKHVETPEEMCGHGYGYQIWCTGRQGGFNFNGMLGQNVVVYPDTNMVIVTNAGSDELFQNCQLMSVIAKYFEGDFVAASQLPPEPLGEQYLRDVCTRLERDREPAAEIRYGGWHRRGGRRKMRPRGPAAEQKIKQLDGCEYHLNETQAGIFPLIMQVLHNNFTDGIERIAFRYQDEKSWLLIKEGEGWLQLPIGFGEAQTAWITLHGEPYFVGIKGRFSRNEYDCEVLLLDIAFLEEAARRKIKITFLSEDEIDIEFDESPGKELITEGMGEMIETGVSITRLHTLLGLDSLELPAMVLDRTIRPLFHGHLVREARRDAAADAGKQNMQEKVH